MEFVPVKSFDSYVEANILKGRLEQENIVCHLTNEYSVTINPVLTNSVGGIQLCVSSVQLERCMDLLRSYDHCERSCPECESTEIIETKVQAQPQSFVEKALVFLLGASALPEQTLQRCLACGNEVGNFYHKKLIQKPFYNG
jgi:hypothetical protein